MAASPASPAAASVPSAIAQRLMDAIVRAPRASTLDRIRAKALRLARRAALQLADPLIQHPIGDRVLQLPLSHNLPIYETWFPGLNDNLARLAQRLHQQQPSMTIVDIGANVGDTMAVIRTRCPSPILCIEGNPRYFPILSANARQFSDVELAMALVGAEDARVAGRLLTNDGTARIVANTGPLSGSRALRLRPLPSILDEHPRFAQPRLIKIDTDGYDCQILRSSAQWLALHQPVIFFEYCPNLLEQLGDDGLSVFDTLRYAGYTHAIVYDIGGGFRTSLPLTDKSTLRNLHVTHCPPQGHPHLDFCVFPACDVMLYEDLRRREAGHDPRHDAAA